MITGAPPDAVKATARHILVPTIEDGKCQFFVMLNLQCYMNFISSMIYLSTIKFATATIVQYIANKVLAEIGKGETSFAALASQYSTCPSSSRGGSLGSFAPGTMVKEFDEVVFAPNTKVGSILGPVQTQFGYHLICVDKRTGGGDWY